MHHLSRMRGLRLSLLLLFITIIGFSAYGLQAVQAQDGSISPPTCPAGTTQVDLVTWGAVLTIPYSPTLDVTLSLNSPAQAGTLLVQSTVGHPEAGCPASGSPLCEDQDNESFNVLVNGAQFAFIPDHGNDQTQVFDFPLNLDAGDHTITFAHSLAAGNNPFGSVFVNAVYCIGAPPVSTPTPTPTPPPDTTVSLCMDSDGTLGTVVRVGAAPDGLTGLYCRTFIENGRIVRPNAFAEIGDPAVIALGILHAVDIFHLGEGSVSGTEICLLGSGQVIFLSAAQAPRFPQLLPAVQKEGFTCATIPTAGIVVLTRFPLSLSQQHATASADAQLTALNDCRVTTLNMLNLRSEPSTTSAAITLVPYDLTLTATEAIPGWYRVIYEDGQGWLSADYVTTTGSCG